MARSADDEEATATTVCLMSETSRVEGSIIRSLVNAVWERRKIRLGPHLDDKVMRGGLTFRDSSSGCEKVSNVFIQLSDQSLRIDFMREKCSETHLRCPNEPCGVKTL